MLAEPKEVAIEIRPLIKPIVLNPGKDAGGNQQHHYAGEGVGHSTVGDFQPAKDVFGVETAQELEDRRQQHAANEDGDNVQLRPPFTVKDQHADDRGKRQNGIQRRGGGGDVVDIEHLVRNVLFYPDSAARKSGRSPCR